MLFFTVDGRKFSGVDLSIITALAACVAGAMFGLYKYRKARKAESAIQWNIPGSRSGAFKILKPRS
jgi:hypothetical protein